MPSLNYYNPNPNAFPDQEPGEKDAEHQVNVCKVMDVVDGPRTARILEGSRQMPFKLIW